MVPFTEGLRYEIPSLTPESLVIDGGAYQGVWGRLVCEKYGCKVHLFEPIRSFYVAMNTSLDKHPQRHLMKLHNMGLGGITRNESFAIKGDSSGAMADGPKEEVFLLGIDELLNLPDFAGKPVGALKLNVEGGEYEILEALLAHGLQRRIEVLHVQPHALFEDARIRWDRIMERMSETHELLWNEPWCWSGWRLKT
jgi:FkbM family methyltransferase